MISRHSSSSRLGSTGFLGRSSNLHRVCSSNLMASSANTDRASEATGLNSPSDEARPADINFLDFATESLPRSSSPTEYRADLGAAVAATPRPEARDSLWARIVRCNAWLEDSWLGDLIGVICLFFIGYSLVICAWVLS